ncbi:alpha-2-macroglobulin receptor-associated protein [Diachasma alloeum]|uniref:alpha-2-macroglobulin receptor-associated protein n=1 Tax=Diachasma alloeum TaxID=454923 RepID=UPI000738460C|nr:alpha-2-macroglobulin receptor-associated protein [Diachasma alloeum]
MSKFTVFCLLLGVYSILLISQCASENKYSADANKATKPNKNAKKVPIIADGEIPVPTSIRELDKPYRMAKLNLLWTKAKHRLTDPKLQSLFSELKLHDKAEVAYKHYRADGKDEEGLEEARLRKKLIGIMSTYGLLEHFAATDDPELLKHHKALNDGSNYAAKEVFEDKRLNQLWAKAEKAGFTHEELEALKEEFVHHQEKVDEYMSLLKDVEGPDPEAYKNSVDEEHESWNEIDHKEEESNSVYPKKVDYIATANLLREKHIEIKSGYDNLDRLTAQGKNHQEFVEPKVQGLWRIAKKAQFTKDELASLKEELRHYETRLLKLRHLHTEAALEAARNGKDYDADNSTKQNIKKHARTVEKLHADIESRILERHTEL